jgi:type VI secretion system protein VasJ
LLRAKAERAVTGEALGPAFADIDRRLAPLLAPLVPPPCGVDARFEPAHEDVRSEVAKLDSPGAPPVSWRRVALRGGELLTSTSKDLLIASYVAHALYEDEGVAGLAQALRLINELMDRYWDALFPPPARLRARAAAIGWWVEKTSARLEGRLAEGATFDPALLGLLEAESARLAVGVRARMGDAAPAVGPLQRAIERLKLAAPVVPVAGAEPVPAPAAAPPFVAVEAPAPAPAVSEIAAGEPAASAAATTDSPEDLDRSLDARAAEWLAPIRDDAPAGDDARYDDGYSRIRDAIKRLDMPTAQPVDWQEILRESSALLRTRSKDLLIASHLAHALFETRRLDGAITGLSLLHGLLAKFWDGLYPDVKRGTRARGSALAWWLPRLEQLASYPLTKEELPLVPLLERAVARLDAEATKLGDSKPAFGRVHAALTRVGFAAQALAQVAPVAPATPTATEPVVSAAPAAAPAPAAPAPAVAPKSVTVAVPADTAPAPSVANKAELNLFFTRLRGQLWDVANALRGVSDSDPLAYRLSRVASYLTLVEPLQHKDNVTPLPAPSPLVASEIAAMGGKQEWSKVLATAEGSLRKNPYLLDLHRHVHAALGHLGDTYRPAQASVEAELQSLLCRLPQLPQLKFQDGSSFADDATRGFLAGLGRGDQHPGGAGASSGAAALPVEELEAAQRLVAAGQTGPALDAFHGMLGRIEQGRDRFRARLIMARACASAGSDAMAVALFEGLVADLDRHGLDEWEPQLASECLVGYHQCLRSLAPRDKEMAEAAAVVYRRLCRVDPKRALSVSLSR